MKEFNVGDVVWWAACGNGCVTEDCPVCFARRSIVVTLGNGEQVQVECDYCSKGYERARGFVEERYEWRGDVKQVVIEKKEVVESGEGRRVEYYVLGCYVLRPEQAFATKQEADQRTAELILEHNREQEENIARRKENNSKSYGWHVGYHRRRAAQARKDLDYHESKVVAMGKLARQ